MALIEKQMGLRELKTALYRLNELIEDAGDAKAEEWVRKQFEISFDIVVSILRSELARQGVPTRSARECIIEAISHKMLPRSEAYKRLLDDYSLLQTRLKPAQARLVYDNIRDKYRDELNELYEELNA